MPQLYGVKSWRMQTGALYARPPWARLEGIISFRGQYFHHAQVAMVSRSSVLGELSGECLKWTSKGILNRNTFLVRKPMPKAACDISIVFILLCDFCLSCEPQGQSTVLWALYNSHIPCCWWHYCGWFLSLFSFFKWWYTPTTHSIILIPH